MVKKVAIVTGTRAEYGLLKPLLDQLHADAAFDSRLIVTGAHLVPEFGMTVEEIRADGVAIADEIEMMLGSDSRYGTAKSVGLGTIGFADSFRRLRPALVVVLGDRFEILAAATAAMLTGVPIAHIHGGERTEGAVDESIRHAITKMSHLHFVSTEEYARRVIQLGEQPDSVFHVGAIGLDRIDRQRITPKREVAERLGLPRDLRWCATTYHPVTLEHGTNEAQFQQVLDAVALRRDVYFVFTKANADAEGRRINAMIEAFVAKHDNAALFDSLGSQMFLSLMAASDFVLGNSSSGIIEAPFLGIPTIDIGNRQRGRVHAPSVLHVEPTRDAVADAMERCASNACSFRFDVNPYYAGGATQQIVRTLKERQPAHAKQFHDVNWSER